MTGPDGVATLRELRKGAASLVVVDAHTHLRSGKLSGLRPRLSAANTLALLLEDMELAGVTTSLVITWPEDVPVVASEALLSPGTLYCLQWFDSRRPDRSLREMVILKERFPALLIGAKTVFPYLYQSPLQREFFPLYTFCQANRLPIQFHFGGNPMMEAVCRPSLFATLARTFPELSIVCLHAGAGWYRQMPELLATYPNIYLEVEALQLHEVELSLPPQVLLFLIRHCGSARLMFGSDRLRREDKYFRRVETIRAVPPPYRDDLCYRTASRVYGLQPLP